MSVVLVSCILKFGPFDLSVYILVYYCLYQTQFPSDCVHACVGSHFLQAVRILESNRVKMREGRIGHCVCI